MTPNEQWYAFVSSPEYAAAIAAFLARQPAPPGASQRPTLRFEPTFQIVPIHGARWVLHAECAGAAAELFLDDAQRAGLVTMLDGVRHPDFVGATP